MNLIQSLVAQAQQKKQQLQNNIGNAVHTVATDVSHFAPPPRPAAPAPQQYHAGLGVMRPGVAPMVQPHFSVPQVAQMRQQPVAPRSGIQEIGHAIGTVGHAAGLGLARAGTGIAQDVSGLVDLATPGTGTSRFTKATINAGKSLDNQAAQIQGPAHAGYNIGQVAGNIASFIGPGEVAGAARGIPTVAKAAGRGDKFIAPATKLVEKGAAKVATRGAGGRMAAQGIRGVASPAGLLNAGVGTAQSLGNMSSKGQDISPINAAGAAAMNVAMAAGIPMAAQGAKELAPALIKGAKATNKAVQASHEKQNVAANYDATINNLQNRKAELQQRIQKTTNFRGVETTQKHIDQIDGQIAQTKAAKPKLSVKDRLLSPNIGLSTQGVRPVDVPAHPTYGTLEDFKNKYSVGLGEVNKLKRDANGTEFWGKDQQLSRQIKGKGIYSTEGLYNHLTAPKATPAPQLPDAAVPPQLPAGRGTGEVSSAKPTIELPARNADAERTALEKLQNGGTNDEAVYAYMKSTGKGLQESVKAVGKAANEAGLTSDGGKNPLLGSVKVPAVQEGDFAQAHHNANYVQGHEQRVGNQAVQSFKNLSAKDQNLLRDIEGKPVEEVAKGADNPQAFTQAAKDIRTYYDTRHAYDNYLGMDVGYRANYLRHIFDKADQASPDSQIAIKNGTKRPGYTKARTKDSIASDVLDTLQRDIKGSSYNHAKLTYEQGMNQAVPDKIANGQAVATPTDGQYDQLHHPFGKALFAPKDVAHDINSRTWSQTDSKALETYDKINRGLKYTKLSGGLFHAFTEAGNFAGQQLASGKMLTNPAATGRLAKVFFSKGAMDGEVARLEANGVADNARLAGLTTTAKEILADADVPAIERMKESKWNPLKQMHDATFQREIPYAKMKIFEQKTAGLDAHNPKDLAKMRQVARETNQIFGGIDRMTSGIKPGTFKWLQRGLLATDFTEGKWHTLSDALTSKGPAGNLARQTVAGKAILFGILATAGGAASGEYNGKSPKDIAKNAAGNLLDPSFKAGSYTAKLPKTHISEAIDAVKPYNQAKGAPWNASGLIHYGQARAAALPSEAIQLLSNKDYYGQPIYGKNTKKAGGGPISPAKVALNVTNTVAPIPFGQGVSTAQGKQNVAAAIANVAGLNVRPTPADKTATGNTPVDKLKATEKQQGIDLKASLSPEDQKLSTLSKADRQKLINNGSYTADKFKGLDNYVANQKKQLGMNTGTPTVGVSTKIDPHSQKVLNEYNTLDAATRKSKAYKENDYDYKVAQAKYDNAVANGTLSKAQQISQKDAVAKAKVGSSFSKDTRDLYGLSKDEVYGLITSDDNGKQIAADLLKYGDALQAATGTKNKFRTSKGAESFATAKKGSGGSSGGSKTSLNALLAGFKTPYSDMVKSSTKGASLARSAHLAKKRA